MERVYLLLRNNLESGPFTFDELLQQQLRPSDLIWVEGRSTAWAHLSEFEFLPKHIDAEYIAPEGEKQFHRDSIESRAEAIRIHTLSYTYHRKPQIEFENDGELQSATGVPIEIIHHTPKRSGPSLQLLGAGVVTVLVGASLYGGWSFIRNNDKPEESVAIRLLSTESTAAKSPLPKNTALVLAVDTTKSVAMADSTVATPIKPVRKTQKPAKDSEETVVPDTTHIDEKREAPPKAEPMVDKTASAPVTNNVAPAQKKEEDKKDTVAEEKREPVIEEKKEKKGLGQMIKGIFKKKKKKDEEQKEVQAEN